MNISFFSENSHSGKIPDKFANARTEFCWQKILDADHHNLCLAAKPDYNIPKYDLGIIIPPKNKQLEFITINKIKSRCSKLAFMQEGSVYAYQDKSPDEQINFYNKLLQANFLLCHNQCDVNYFKGINERTYILPTLMLEEFMPTVTSFKVNGVILGGNWCSYYSGIDSYMVARAAFDQDQIYAPKTGRMNAEESKYCNILSHFYTWRDWIRYLDTFPIAVHLNRSALAGTFALNCARLGIPCIGYSNTDTQRICHPDTTVGLQDINTAKKIILMLKNDKQFYDKCVVTCRNKYIENYSEKIWLEKWKDICTSENIYAKFD